MTELLPEYSWYLTTVLEGVRSIPLDKWLWAAAPMVAALIQPATAKIFPDWGDGVGLFTVTATRGASVGQYLWLKSTTLLTPLVVGSVLLSQSAMLPGLALLVGCLGVAVHLGVDHKRARSQVTFCRNRFRLNGISYQYSDLALISEQTLNKTRFLRWKKYEVVLTEGQYETIRPGLLQQGWGPTDSLPHSNTWNLK